MPSASVNAIILWTSSVTRSVAFYRAIGCPLNPERHGDGPGPGGQDGGDDDGTPHFACELGDVHFAIYPGQGNVALERGQGGAIMPAFRVSSLDSTLAALRKAGARIIVAPEQVPWGQRVVVEDPDGRPVEIVQSPIRR